MNFDITEISTLLVKLAFLCLTVFAIPYFKNKLGNEKFNDALGWVKIAVSAAEQLYNSNQGNEKKGCQEGSNHCNVCKCLCRRHYQQPAGWNECSSCKAAGCGKNDCCLKTMHGR